MQWRLAGSDHVLMLVVLRSFVPSFLRSFVPSFLQVFQLYVTFAYAICSMHDLLPCVYVQSSSPGKITFYGTLQGFSCEGHGTYQDLQSG
jgi:hypothetical protein